MQRILKRSLDYPDMALSLDAVTADFVTRIDADDLLYQRQARRLRRAVKAGLSVLLALVAA